MENPSNECLRLFDQFDLENSRESRLAVYALEDYFCLVLSEAGEELLGFTPNDTERGLGVQWNKAKMRFESADLAEIPDEYNDVLHRLNDERDLVAHDYQYHPRKDRLLAAREIAEEWRDWFLESSENYYEQEGELSIRETLYNLIKDCLEYGLVDPDYYEFPELQERQKEINDRIFSFVYYDGMLTFDDVDESKLFTFDYNEGEHRLIRQKMMLCPQRSDWI